MDRYLLMAAIIEATNLNVRRVGRSRKHWEIVRRVENPKWANLPQPRNIPRYADECVSSTLKYPTKTKAEEFLMAVYRPIAEWWLLYAIIVAGKSAKFAEHKTHKFLFFIHKGRKVRARFNMAHDETPFEYINRIGCNGVGSNARFAGTGNYKRIIPAFVEIACTEVYSWTLEKLESVQGIGPKTARFWLKVALGQTQYAILDVHILRWLQYLGYEVPQQTPSNPKYLEIEKIFIAEAKERQMSPGTLDTMIWEFCHEGWPASRLERGGPKITDAITWPQTLKRRERP